MNTSYGICLLESKQLQGNWVRSLNYNDNEDGEVKN